MIFLSNSLKKLLAITIMCLSVFAGSTTALALIYPKEIYDEIAYNYKEIGPADPNYNCLAYALGNTTSWIWPWSTDTATQSQVDNYLNLYGYSGNSFGYVYATPGIISYGHGSDAINHFARATASYVAKSKWGQWELMETTWDPYKRSGYGPAQRYYK